MELTVERSLHEHEAGGASIAWLDPEVMQRNDWQAGDLLRVSTFFQEIVVRLAKPDEGDRGTGHLRLDRFQRQALKARLYGKVDISPEKSRATAKVRLQPGVDLGSADAHHIEEHLKEELIHHQTPVTVGAVLFLHFHHSVAGTLYKVVEVEGGFGVVTEDTDVVLDAAPDGFSGTIGLDLTFEDLGGLDREIGQIKELVQLPLQFPAVYRQMGIAPVRGVILYGPPGTGKTLLARATANELDAQFYYINGPEIIGSTYGESEGNLRRIFGEAIHHAPSVIFIDELDAIAIKRGESGSHADTRLVTQLLSLMDGVNKVDGVVVMGTTNRIDSLDVALRRPGRFDHELYIGPPDRAGREQVLAIHTREMPLDEEARAYLPQLAAETSGFVGADLMALCRSAGLIALRHHAPHAQKHGHWHADEIRVTRDNLVEARRQSRPSAARGSLVVEAEEGFDRIAGLSVVKSQLTDTIVAPMSAGEPVKDGVLLFGPSGVGKSMLAKAVAKEAGASLIVVNGPELFSKWLGESEEAVRHVFKLARELSPCVVFFDHLDAIAPIRGRSTGSWSTERVVHQLVAEIDGLGTNSRIALIAATNRLDLVDEAVLQPGRIGMLVEMSCPDLADREAILRMGLGNIAEVLGPIALRSLATRTTGLSGAHLRALCALIARETRQGKGVDIDALVECWERQALHVRRANAGQTHPRIANATFDIRDL